MQKLIPAIVAVTLLGSAAALAQTTPPASQGQSAAEKQTAPPASPAVASEPITLTDAQAKNWIDKVVYDSDGKKFGEVAAFARDGSGKVTEMHADIGGFLGLGQTRVRLMPSQFKLIDDRAVLSLTAEQAKTLPKVES
jgi:PRC-barrel domain protein